MTSSAETQRATILLAPLSGLAMDITQVPDPTFAEKMLGDGIAIDPMEEVLRAPCDGTITQLHKANHALTITSSAGVEILLHIGLETVLLKGKGFTPHVREGQRVAVGERLISFDASYLAHHAASLLTMTVITGGAVITGRPVDSALVEGGKTPILIVAPSETGIPQASDGPVKTESSAPLTVRNAAGIHARPAAALASTARRFAAAVRLVKGDRDADAKSVVAIMGLGIEHGDAVLVRATGTDAAEAVAALSRGIEAGLGEKPGEAPIPAQAAAVASRPPSHDPDHIGGISASPGLAVGKTFRLLPESVEVPRDGRGVSVEKQDFMDALAGAKRELRQVQQTMKTGGQGDKAAIFLAQGELLEDPVLLDAAHAGIATGESAAFAWKKAYTSQADTLAAMTNQLLAARATDIRDVGRRVLQLLTHTADKTLDPPEGSILLAAALTPSETAGLDLKRVRGIATVGGSATSHVAILAKAAGLPAMAAAEERMMDVPDGTMAILDADKGDLWLHPPANEVERVRKLQDDIAARREAERAAAREPAVTMDGHTVRVAANIGAPAEAERIHDLGADGVGLLRSEFLFLDRNDAPSEEEQAAAYAAVARAVGPGRDMVVRTLDVGGDKPLSYLPLPPEDNPFLGIRGIRLESVHPEIIAQQIRAILPAAAHCRLHIMFPMVADIGELRQARDMVEREKEALGIRDSVKIGMMVEVPSAALLAEGLAREADFFSIGTNDLTQYVLAADRGNPRLASMADGLHPAVLTLIARTVAGAHKHGRPVGVCGAIASDPDAIPLLLGLGVDELSVAVSSLPGVRAAVRRYDFARCRSLAEEVLAMLSAEEVRERAKRFVAETRGK